MSFSSTSLRWQWYGWGELDANVLHAFLKLRADIFVVEQNCVFHEIDGIDPKCEHLCGWLGGELVAYLRLLPPGLKSPEVALGRVVVARAHRRRGHSREALERGLDRVGARFPGKPIRVQAQAHLAPFYETLGFTRGGAEYVEDGIPHVDMLKQGLSAGR
jgi:ElaA protein